jgi:signal transduction histidine kinase
MPTTVTTARLFNSIKRDIKSKQLAVLESISHISDAAKKAGNLNLAKLCAVEKKNIKTNFKSVLDNLVQLQTDIKAEARRSSQSYKKVIHELEKLKEDMATDNILLELKKKDLLQKADELENAYDEIAARNKELMSQKKIITEQTEELKRAHEEILEKNNLLEARTESLQDQADYLHEANEAITQMHHELQAQKDEIESKNQELLNLNTEKNNLMGIVAHDLKSPLNQIKGLVSIIKITTKDLDGEAANCLNMIENSANRLSGMITKILDTEAIESKKLNLIMEPLNFAELVAAVKHRYEVDANRKNILLKENIKSSVMITADKSYLDQVIDNLLSNAIKFSPTDKNIFINLTVNDGEVRCEIKDEGPGLNDEDKRKLFSKYQKLSARPTGNETSTGLGLSIVKKFVEAMEGKIWCESEFGEGASFFVSFKTNA